MSSGGDIFLLLFRVESCRVWIGQSAYPHTITHLEAGQRCQDRPEEPRPFALDAIVGDGEHAEGGKPGKQGCQRLCGGWQEKDVVRGE